MSITLKSLKCEKHILFKELNWKLNENSLTVIRGLNQDRKNNSGNAVGKSLLPATLATVINDSPPIAIKTKSSADLIKQDSRVTLDLSNNKTDWRITQFAKGNSVNYEILKDFENISVKGINNARNMIREKIFPLSEDQFYSQVYISSFRPSVLLYGKPSARMEYFESIFSMRIYDLVHKKLLGDLRKINGKKSEFELLNQQKLDLLPRAKYNVIDKLRETKQHHQDLLQEYQKLNNELQKLSAFTTIVDQLNSSDTVDILKVKLKTAKTKHISYKKKLHRLYNQQGAADQSREIYKKRKKISKQLLQLSDYELVDRSKSIEICNSKITEIEKNLAIFAKAEPYLNKYHKFVVRSPQWSAKIETEFNDLQTALTKLEHSLEQQRKLKVGSFCPLCNQKITRSHKYDLKKLTNNINRSKRRQKIFIESKYCFSVKEKIPYEVISLDKLEAEKALLKLKSSYNNLQKRQKLFTKKEELIKNINMLPVVKKLKSITKEIKPLENKINLLDDKIQEYEQDIELQERLKTIELEFEPQKAKSRLEKIQKVITKISPTLNKVSDEIHSLVIKHTEYKEAIRRLEKINEQLIEIDAIVSNRIVIESLVQAYSSKGFRIFHLQSIAKAYTDKLNNLAPFIYTELMNFSANVDLNTFNITAERHHKISDVRFLSGSESRQFLAISALALISMMTNQNRVNNIILDELESGLSLPEKTLFCEEYLPRLANTVKHVQVITPHSSRDMKIPGAVEKTLVRKNGQTNWL